MDEELLCISIMQAQLHDTLLGYFLNSEIMLINNKGQLTQIYLQFDLQ